MADVQAPTSGVETSPPRSTSLDRTRQARPSGAMTHRGPVVNAWADGVMASPRTPRPHQSELRTVGLAVSELQRLCAEDRRVMQRQLDSFDRRLQEHLAAPAASREKWANLQGSVSGLLEEVASLVRRVETLDEKLRIRTASCEELLRQRSRELEQQLHGQQQKVQLAVSTFEEMSKRQTAKLRKVSQSTEEQARKMVALEDTVRRAQGGHTSPLEAMQARLAELEGQQASLEEEFRHVAASSAIAQAMTPTHAAPLDEDYEGQRVAARALESELATLSKQLASQLDEHSAALANLRVRTESQEQRLTAAGDRLEKVVAPTVEAVRNEMQQLRLADRSEIEQQLEHFTRQLKELADSNEEALSEVREHVQASADGQAELQRIREACLMQEQAQRFVAMDPPQREEEINEVLLRVERLENQLETFNHEPVNEKADRADVHRLDLQLQELEQPLRRLSQRTASNEARTTGLEHKLEQFQERLPNAKTDPKTNPAELSSLQAISKQMAEISARLVELEKVQKTQALPNEALRRLEGMEKSLQSTNREGAKLPSDSSLPEQVGTQLDELSGLVSKALKVAENSGSNMQALRFDLVVEQERVAKLNKDLQALTSLVREEQSKMQRSVERQEDQEGRAADALHKMATSIQKVQALQHGFEGSASALNKLVESIVKRVEATEVALKESPNATEVHMLRDSLRADLLEAQQERFQDLESKFLEKAGEKATQEVDDEAFIQEDDDVPDGDITFSEQKAFEQKDVKKTSALELQKEWSNVSQRADEALRLAQGNDELFSSLRDLRPKFEVLERQLLEKVEDCESTLREELVKLEAKTQTVSKMANSSEEAIKDLQKSVNDAMQRVEASEEASKAVREELMSEDLQGEALTLARTCQSDLRGVHSDVADLQASLRKLASHVDQEMEERRGRPLQEVPRRLESRVQDLQKQVAEELEQLAKHQSLITQVLQVEAKVSK